MISLRFVFAYSAIALCLLSLSGTAFSADGGSIRGQVISSKGIPMAGASAYLLPSKQRVTISDDGMYVIPNIETGVYQVAVVHPGYHFYISSFITVSENQEKAVVLVMRNSSEQNTAEYDGIRSELERVLRQCSVKKHPEQSNSTASKDQKPIGADTKNTEKKEEQTPVVNTKVYSSNTTEIAVPVAAPASDNNEEHHDATHSTDDLVTEVSVIPNPVTDRATVSFELSKEGSILLEIFSVASGERILIKDLGKQKVGTNSTELDFSNLPHGSYTALLRASTCQYALTTFVKE